LLPPNLAYLQLVPFSAGDADSAFELAAALRDLPPAQPLPEPLPPPPVPMSYLTTLAEQVRSPHPLDADAQLALVARLEAAAVQDDDRDAALQLAQQLLGRPDLYHSAARNLERLLSSGPATAPPERVAPPPPQRQGWWVHSMGGDANTRTLQLQNGRQSWSVRLDFPRWATNKVLVDGQRREITEKLVWIGAGTARCLFTIDRSDGPPVPCEFRIDGMMQLKGLILEVQGRVVHREGTLAG
jgi:hypothetical protein